MCALSVHESRASSRFACYLTYYAVHIFIHIRQHCVRLNGHTRRARIMHLNRPPEAAAAATHSTTHRESARADSQPEHLERVNKSIYAQT